jgi:hypothetical protein
MVSIISRSAGLFLPPGGEPGQTLAERAAAQREERARREAQLPPAATGVSRLSRDTQEVGASLFRYAGLPFEIASVLLLVAIVGSVLLARTAKQEAAADDLDPEVKKSLESGVWSLEPEGRADPHNDEVPAASAPYSRPAPETQASELQTPDSRPQTLK